MKPFASDFDALSKPVREALEQTLRQAGTNASGCRTPRQQQLKHLDLAVSLYYASKFSELLKLPNRKPLPADLREANQQLVLAANTLRPDFRVVLVGVIDRELSAKQLIWYLTRRGEFVTAVYARRNLQAAADVNERLEVIHAVLDGIKAEWTREPDEAMADAMPVAEAPVSLMPRSAQPRRRQIRR